MLQTLTLGYFSPSNFIIFNFEIVLGLVHLILKSEFCQCNF